MGAALPEAVPKGAMHMEGEDRVTLVIGGGQAGLAMGYELRRRGLRHVIVEQNERIGDNWRTRWDSLKLFTPGRYNALPGLRFPGRPWACPSKDEVAEYFETYATTFALPVRTGCRITRLERSGNRFDVYCGDELLRAANVVIATGAYHRPRIPSFAASLDTEIFQLHSSQYRNPDQLREGGTLVVGAGNSGAEIALEIAGQHKTWLSGPDTGHEPARAGSKADRLFTPFMWLIATRLTVNTSLGRKMRDHFLHPPRGIPLARVRRSDLVARGIECVGRTTGVRDRRPMLDDGRVLDASNVIWCTGYTPDLSWIDLPIATRHGFPIHDRGVIDAIPGLYFIGLPFLHSLSSALLGGVGRDAAYLADHILARSPAVAPGNRR